MIQEGLGRDLELAVLLLILRADLVEEIPDAASARYPAFSRRTVLESVDDFLR